MAVSWWTNENNSNAGIYKNLLAQVHNNNHHMEHRDRRGEARCAVEQTPSLGREQEPLRSRCEENTRPKTHEVRKSRVCLCLGNSPVPGELCMEVVDGEARDANGY